MPESDARPHSLLDICKKFSSYATMVEPLSQEDAATLAQALEKMALTNDPTDKFMSQEDGRALVRKLATLAITDVPLAINSSFIVMIKAECANMAISDELIQEVILPNVGRIPDSDLELLRQTAAKTASYALWITSIPEALSEQEQRSVFWTIAQMLQPLSRSHGQEIQVRELADHIYEEFAEEDVSVLADIAPFTSMGKTGFAPDGDNLTLH